MDEIEQAYFDGEAQMIEEMQRMSDEAQPTIERYRLQRERNAGAYMEPAADGNWVEHSDAAAQLAAKDAEIERLTRAKTMELADANHRANTRMDELVVACRGTPHRSAMELRTALDEATRRLALAVAEVRAARGRLTNRGYALETVGAECCNPKLNAYSDARAATDADPVLRAMVEKGGGEG